MYLGAIDIRGGTFGLYLDGVAELLEGALFITELVEDHAEGTIIIGISGVDGDKSFKERLGLIVFSLHEEKIAGVRDRIEFLVGVTLYFLESCLALGPLWKHFVEICVGLCVSHFFSQNDEILAVFVAKADRFRLDETISKPFSTMNVMKRLACLFSLLPLLSGCPIERFFPEPVADGVARLTVRTAAGITLEMTGNTTCGFVSPSVIANARIDGTVGSIGTVTYTVNDCEIDFGERQVLAAPDCNSDSLGYRGRLKVSGTQVVEGRLTGDPGTPVIPESTEAAVVKISATMQDFAILAGESPNILTVKNGSLSFSVLPHLAVSSDLGVCSVPTKNLTIEDISWGNSTVHVQSESSSFETEIEGSSLRSQLGRWQDEENSLQGTLTVWGAEVEVPIEGEFDGLDPEYDREYFLESYICDDRLTSPLSYECPKLQESLGVGVARLSVNAVATIAQLLEANAECGFSNQAVKDGVVLTGGLGLDGGTSTNEVVDCVLNFPTRTVYAEDCQGKVSYVEGKVTVSGKKVIKGIRTGDPIDPIVPADRYPAVITVTSAAFENFRISDSAGGNAITFFDGTISGALEAQTAMDTSLGACAIVTPIATLTDIELRSANASLESNGRQFDVAVGLASLTAQNGVRDNRENYLSGTITIDGTEVQVPVSGSDPILNPSYRPETFFDTWTCDENLRIAESDEDCYPIQILAEGTARLTMATLAALAIEVNASDDGGFEDTFGVLIDPVEVVGSDGQSGHIIWEAENVSVGGPNLTLQSEDCLGGKTFIEGVVSVDATRKVEGLREPAFDLFGVVTVGDSIVPKWHEAVSIWIDDAPFNGFSIEPYAPDADEPLGRLTFENGTLSGLLQPILGERQSQAGVYDVVTSVGKLSEVRLVDADIILKSEGKTFKLHVDDALMSGINGSFEGVSNRLSGYIVIDGRTYDFGDTDLNPDFDQATFDSSYGCVADLRELIPVD